MSVSGETIERFNVFAFDLFRIECSKSIKNELFSPLSVLMALNNSLFDESDNAEKEVLEGIRCNFGFANNHEINQFVEKLISGLLDKDEKATLDIANHIFINKNEVSKVKPDYAKNLQSLYNTTVEEVDFVEEYPNIVDSGNEWVNCVTTGGVSEILNESNKPKFVLPKVILSLSTVYFNAAWSEPFNEKVTSMKPFVNFDKKVKMVPYMTKRVIQNPVYSTVVDGVKIRMATFQYKANLSMSILLTDSMNDFRKIITKLDYEIIRNMTLMANIIDYLWIPKFKVECNYLLVSWLKELGVKYGLCSENTHFGNLDENTRVFEALHTASIEVDEGIEAPGVTYIRISQKNPLGQYPLVFRVNYPFVYFIKDESSGAILLLGKVESL